MKLFRTIAVAVSCMSLVLGAGVVTTQASTTGVNPLQSPLPTATTAPTSVPGNTVRCTVKRGIVLNVRATPSIRGRRIGQIRSGTSFVCLSRVGNWLKLIYRGRVGWVHRSYVTCNRAI
jgi:hypothetical protein